MSHELELTTKKYMLQVLEQDRRARRWERNRKAMEDFFTFVMGLAAIAIVTYAVQHASLWMPYVEPFLNR